MKKAVDLSALHDSRTYLAVQSWNPVHERFEYPYANLKNAHCVEERVQREWTDPKWEWCVHAMPYASCDLCVAAQM